MIVVVIALATGIGGPLGSYLKTFSGALLGPEGYYACLTERGLLPGDPQVPSECSDQAHLAMGALNQIQTGSGFGSSGGGSVNNGGGNNNNGSNPADNNWNNNRDSNDSGNNNDNADSSGNEKSFKDSKSSKDESQNASRHKAGLSGQEGEGSLSGSGGEAFSGDSSNSPSSFLAPNSFSSGKGKKKKKGGSLSGGRGLGSEDEEGAFNSKSQGYKRLRFRAQNAQGYLGEAYLSEEEAEQEKPVFKEVQAGGVSKGSFAGDTKKNQLIPDRKPNQKKDLDTKVKGMNFSAFLKYFVIIALILVVLVVIFSQVMEYQSRE